MHSRGSRRHWLVLLLVPACTVSAPVTPASISLAIVNATVWTGDPRRPIVEAIAISDGLIAALGPTPEIRALAGDGNVLDADGALITPGFIDTHIHLLDAGRRLVQEGSSGQLYDDDELLLSIGSSALRTPEENDEALVAALNYLVTQGVTSVHHMGNWDDLETLRRAEIQGRLTARVNVVLPIASSGRLVNAIASGQFGGEQGQGSEWVRVGAVKGVVDGTFATRTAAIDLPYPGTGDDRGLLLYDEESLYEEVVDADDAGLQVALHAVGERATNLAIDVYERLNQEREVKDRRFRLEHAQHLLDSDLIRLARLGILINVQPAQIMYAARQFDSIYDSDSRTVSFPLRTLLEFRARVDAIEWINGDSQWRSTGVLSLLSAGLHYFFRPVGSLTRVLHRPTDAMNMWDAMASNASVVGLAGLDAHARLATGSGDEGYTGGFVFRFPWYEELFRLFSIQVNLDRAQTGNAGADAVNLLTSIRTGQVYSSVEGRATPAEVTFFASLSNGDIVKMGDRTPSNQELQLVVKVNGPSGAAIRLLRNGIIISESTNLELTYSVNSSDAPAVYRTEVYLSEFAEEVDLPWIVSNPIFIGSRETENLPSTPFRESYGANPNSWRMEQHTDAEVTLDLNDDILELSYTLGNSPATYAAMAYDIGTERITSDVSIDFVVRASKPMRISAQLRRGAGEDSRWQHSFYADQRDRRVRLPVRDFTPVEAPNSGLESVSGVDSLLFVVDTVNYQRNSSGELQISGLRLGEQ